MSRSPSRTAGFPVAAQTAAIAAAIAAQHTADNGTFMTLAAMAANPDLLTFGTITRDVNGAATAAPVTWPDGNSGAYAALVVSPSFPGAVDSYSITRVVGGVTTTYTQPTVTRNSSGAVTTRPAITVT